MWGQTLFLSEPGYLRKSVCPQRRNTGDGMENTEYRRQNMKKAGFLPLNPDSAV
jgi:hypothetical protein